MRSKKIDKQCGLWEVDAKLQDDQEHQTDQKMGRTVRCIETDIDAKLLSNDDLQQRPGSYREEQGRFAVRKPIYAGKAIFDILLLFDLLDFHYDFIRPLFKERCRWER